MRRVTTTIWQRRWTLVAVVLAAALLSGRTAIAGGHAAPAHGDSHGGGHDSGGHDSSGHGDAHGGGHAAAAPMSDSEFAAATDSKVRGIEMGEYYVRTYHQVEAQKSAVRFVLHALAPKERYQEVSGVVDQYRHKIHDQVIVATRMAPLAVFNEADLKSFRRRIIMRLKRALPELEIDDVYVSDFHLTVQSL